MNKKNKSLSFYSIGFGVRSTSVQILNLPLTSCDLGRAVTLSKLLTSSVPQSPTNEQNLSYLARVRVK